MSSPSLRFEDVSIVLVRPLRGANIGAACRAMKTMGLTRLTLVKPRQAPGREAHTLAHNATDVLDQALVVETLEEALQDHALCIGTSAREGRDRMAPLKLRKFVNQIMPQYLPARVALIFGPEDSGLTLEELDHCQFTVQVPTGPLCHSLNLSHAVMVVCYELFTSLLDESAEAEPLEPAREQRTHEVYRGIEAFLHDIGYPSSSSLIRAMADVKRVLGTTYLTQRDAQTLMGMFRHIRYMLRHGHTGNVET